MGYGCVICDDCLELPAPEYKDSDMTDGSAGAAGAAGQLPEPPRVGTSRARKPAAPRKGKNVRSTEPTDVVVTSCGHMFHRSCIERWYNTKKTMNCPACRKSCPQSKLTRVFPAVVLYHPALEDDFKYEPFQAPPKVIPLPPISPKTEFTIKNLLGSPTPNLPGPSSACASATISSLASQSQPETCRPLRQGSMTLDSVFAAVIARATAPATVTSSATTDLDPLAIPTPALPVQTTQAVHNIADSDSDDGDSQVYSSRSSSYGNHDLTLSGQGPPAPRLPQAAVLQQQAQGECNRPDCQDIRYLRQTLMQDFDDVNRKYMDSLEDAALKEAQVQSLEDTLRIQTEKIADLERERDILKANLQLRQSYPTAHKRANTSNETASRGEVTPPKRSRNGGDDNPPNNGGNGLIF